MLLFNGNICCFKCSMPILALMPLQSSKQKWTSHECFHPSILNIILLVLIQFNTKSYLKRHDQLLRVAQVWWRKSTKEVSKKGFWALMSGKCHSLIKKTCSRNSSKLVNKMTAEASTLHYWTKNSLWWFHVNLLFLKKVRKLKLCLADIKGVEKHQVTCSL